MNDWFMGLLVVAVPAAVIVGVATWLATPSKLDCVQWHRYGFGYRSSAVCVEWTTKP
jgi:hypothetical protein